MEMRIKTTDYHMTGATRAYLDERLVAIEKLIDPTDQTAMCEIEIKKATGHHQRGNIWNAEFQIIRGSEHLRAVADGESVNAAIDGAKDEMLRQLRHSKGKRFATMRRAGKRVKDWMRFGNT